MGLMKSPLLAQHDAVRLASEKLYHLAVERDNWRRSMVG